MDLLHALLKEHSKTQTDRIVRYIGSDPERFAVLMALFFKGEYRVTQRAAWPMSYCVQKHPELIRPYFRQLLTMLKKTGTHNAVKRNILRLLQDVEIPKKYQGPIMSLCFDYISDPEELAASKAFALTILENFTADYPEILPELQLLVRDRWEYETPAFRSRGKRILKK